ncbi:MAG: hypothetical protein ACR2FO_05755 [Actinomycetota bacterium]
MEETVKVETSWKRLVGRGAAIGAVAALIAYGKAGLLGSLGALGGSLAAALYVVQYLKSHLSGVASRTAVFDTRVAKGAAIRLTLTALGGLAAYLAGRPVAVAYLLSFVATFTILLITEIPRARRTFQAEVTS